MHRRVRRRILAGIAALLVASVAGVVGLVTLLRATMRVDRLSDVGTSHDMLTSAEVEERTAAFLAGLDQTNGRTSDEVLGFPPKTHKAAALAMAVGFLSEGDTQTYWESDIEEYLGLDLWECAWRDYAHAAHQSDDAEQFALAGEKLLQRADFPRQRGEKNPDVDRSVNEFAAPMRAGVWGPARSRYVNLCPGVEISDVAR